MDKREGREDIAGNVAVRAIPLVLLLISCSILLFLPHHPCLAPGALVVQFSFKEGNRWLA